MVAVIIGKGQNASFQEPDPALFAFAGQVSEGAGFGQNLRPSPFKLETVIDW